MYFYPAYKSLGTSIPRFGVTTSDLPVFGQGWPCALCCAEYLRSLKLVLNRDDITYIAIVT